MVNITGPLPLSLLWRGAGHLAGDKLWTGAGRLAGHLAGFCILFFSSIYAGLLDGLTDLTAEVSQLGAPRSVHDMVHQETQVSSHPSLPRSSF